MSPRTMPSGTRAYRNAASIASTLRRADPNLPERIVLEDDGWAVRWLPSLTATSHDHMLVNDVAILKAGELTDHDLTREIEKAASATDVRALVLITPPRHRRLPLRVHGKPLFAVIR